MKNLILALSCLLVAAYSQAGTYSPEAPPQPIPTPASLHYSQLIQAWSAASYRDLGTLKGQVWTRVAFATNAACAGEGTDIYDVNGALNADGSRMTLNFDQVQGGVPATESVTLMGLGSVESYQGPFVVNPNAQVQFSQWTYNGNQIDQQAYLNYSCKMGLDPSGATHNHWLFCAMGLQFQPGVPMSPPDMNCVQSGWGSISAYRIL